MHAASIIQACFCEAALQEKQQKAGCVWQHLCSADRGELLEDPDRSTSELTVYLHVHRLTSGLKRGTGHDHGYKRHATHMP